MTVLVGAGWGSDAWGSGTWGGSLLFVPGAFILTDAEPIAENIVRITFNLAVFFTGLLDPFDASDPSHYTITPVDGTSGYDGAPTRPVAVVFATQDPATPNSLDLTLDRPMSPYASQYTVSVANVISASGSFALDPTMSSFNFFGLFKLIQAPQLDTTIPTRDIANPQTLSAALDPLPNPQNPGNLGTIVVDGSGDYAFDEGLTNLKKRIYRRLISVPGKTAFLPSYGIGIPAQAKRLSTSGVRAQLAAEAERQIKLEPEVERVLVTVTTNAAHPNLVQFNILVKTKSGGKSKFSVPFSTS